MSKYIQKENALLEAMKADNFAFFDGDEDEALEFIESKLLSLADYVNIVVRQQILIPLWRFRFDPDEVRQRTEDLDRQRYRIHNAAIASLTAINRLFSKHGLPAFAEVDTENRQAVADFAGSYVGDLYLQGTAHNMDEAVEAAHGEEYDTKEVGRILRELM